MAVAADIDDAIAMCPDAVDVVGFDAGQVLFDVYTSWLVGSFDASTGIYTNLVSVNERTVIDWHNPNQVTKLQLDQTATTSPIGDTAGVIDAVSRVLEAVKQATIRGDTSAAQETATVDLFNAVWC